MIIRLSGLLRKVVRWSVIIFFGYMSFAVLAEVVGRYLFNYSIAWSSETATFAQIWMIFLAAGLAMEKNLHVTVDALANLFPVILQKILTAVVLGCCLVFLGAGITGSIPLLAIGQIETSPVLRIPMSIPYLSIPIGLTYFGLEFTLAMHEKWQSLNEAQKSE